MWPWGAQIARARISLLMARMHADELEIDEALARALLIEQFRVWADLPLERVDRTVKRVPPYITMSPMSIAADAWRQDVDVAGV